MVAIPKGNYGLVEIELKSNVHIEIDEDVVIAPVINQQGKSVGIFNFAPDAERIENVSVRGIGGKFTANFPVYEPGIRLFTVGKVQDFMISNYHVNDQLTKFIDDAKSETQP